MNSPSYLKLLSLLSDPTRLRILYLLREQELSVAEVQECLHLGQSRISSHLRQLKDIGLLEDRREGQRTYYSWNISFTEKVQEVINLALKAATELPDNQKDSEALQLILKKRKALTEKYFNTLAGRLGKNYCPGRSWEAIGHLLLELIPSITIADLGAGEGLLSQLLANRAKKVIAVDNSARMVEVGEQLAKENGIHNLEYRLGDLEAPPIRAGSIDLVILCQALHHAAEPEKALRAAYKILKTGGRLLVLDLNQHQFEKARTLYADTWLGFAESDIQKMLARAHFVDIHTNIVAKENESPYFQTLLCSARK
ncbi:MAG: metalloregulator ArsR/SmtB family transcription factor [Verrucomicrobiota bacterium]